MDEIEEIVIILGLIRSRRAGGLPAALPVFLPAAAPSEDGDGMSIPDDGIPGRSDDEDGEAAVGEDSGEYFPTGDRDSNDSVRPPF